MPDTQKEIAKLRAEIAKHDQRYYKDALPSIDDQAYDRLKAQLATLEAASPEFDFGDSPTKTVGDDRLEASPTSKAHSCAPFRAATAPRAMTSLKMFVRLQVCQ